MAAGGDAALGVTWRAMPEKPAPLAWLVSPEEQGAPIITVHDAASHALAWLGGVFGPVTALGVDGFGQSRTRAEL
jgi:pyruvate dehydrogenase E1 component